MGGAHPFYPNSIPNMPREKEKFANGARTLKSTIAAKRVDRIEINYDQDNP